MRLRLGIARDGFIDLPGSSAGWRPSEESYYESVAQAGFEAVQGGSAALCHSYKLSLLGNGVIRDPRDADVFAQSWSDEGALLATCIAGTGFESDAEADFLVDSIAEASRRASLPIFVETHRASVTQDIWRTLRLLERHPNLKINADWSHWFTGLEMPALNWATQLTRLDPVMSQVAFMHGRVGNRCCMQVALGGDAASPYLSSFRDLWTGTFQWAMEQGREEMWFVPELLGTTYEYARMFNGQEEGDRWQDALLLKDVASDSLQAALQRWTARTPTSR